MGFLSNIVNGIKNVAGGIRNAANTVSDWYSKYILGEDDSGTSTPAQAPSTAPSTVPTQAPSTTPTQAPSTTPTQTPSTAPSTAPTQTPSTAPTGAPSGTPGGTSEAPGAGAPGTTAPSGTPETTAPSAVPGTTENSEFSSQYAKDEETGEEHIPTYEEFLLGNTKGYDHIRTETSAFYDEQANKTLAALDEQKSAADDYAAGQRDSVYGSLEEQTAEMYKYAESILGESLGYNQQAYDAVVKLLGEELAAGKLNAEEAKKLLLSLAEETKQGVYDTAERQREEAHKNADIYRERANVNAQNAYAQNLAGYGANAEVLGRMGITGGGYGDWVNGNAYATQRAEVQAANAEAEGAKREAVYTEDMLKLQADNEYNKQKGQAEFDYLERLYDLDSNYRTGMAEAEQTKAAADKAAHDTARDTKFQADSLEREGKAEADLDYNKMLYQNDANYKAGKLEAEQVRDAGKFQAEMDYVQNVMQNDERIAEYMEKLKAGDEEAIRQQQEIFSQLLTGASNGTYGAEEIKILAKMFGFDENQTKDLTDTVGRYNDNVQAEKTEALSKERTSNIIGLLDGANTGAYTVDQIPMLAKELGLDPEKDKAVIDVILKAAQAHQDGKSAEDTQYMNGIYADLMSAASSGSLDGEAVAALAKMFGFTNKDEIDALVGASTRRNDKIEAEEEEVTENNRIENEMNLAGSSGDQVGYIDKAIESGAISPEAGSRDLYNHFKDSLTAGNFDYSEVERALNSGSLSQDDFKKLQADYVKDTDTSENQYMENNNALKIEAAVEKVTKILDDPMIDNATKIKLGLSFYKVYGAVHQGDFSKLPNGMSWNEAKRTAKYINDWYETSEGKKFRRIVMGANV